MPRVDDTADLLAEALLEAFIVVLAVVVVLHQHGDFRILDVGQQVGLYGMHHLAGVKRLAGSRGGAASRGRRS